MELTTGRHVLCGLAAALLLASAVPLAGLAYDEEDWLKKSGFGYIEGYYTRLQEFKGGGMMLGGEYVNDAVPCGIGGSFNFDLLMHDTSEYFADDVLGGLNIYLLVRPMDAITLYAGVGGNLHNLTYDFDEGGEMTIYDNTSHRTTRNVFVGARWVFAGHCFVFVEYRKESGKIWISETDSRGNEHIEKVDMSDNRVLLGIGALF